MKQVLLVPYTFLLMNWAAVLGLYYFLTHRDQNLTALWAPAPQTSSTLAIVPISREIAYEEDQAA